MTAINHGTLTGYVIQKCRCERCRAASRTYANRVNRLRAYGQWQPYVDAQPVRDHLAMLASHGIGWMRAARLAGVPTGSVTKLLYGTTQPPRPPSRRVRPETANRLLALRPTLDLLADNALTDATATRRRVQALMALGRGHGATWRVTISTSRNGFSTGEVTARPGDTLRYVGSLLMVEKRAARQPAPPRNRPRACTTRSPI